MGIRNFIKRQPVRVAALVITAPVLLNPTIVRCSQGQLAFLSNSEKGQLPAPDISPLLPPPVVNPYDGRWLFTGAGCRGAGSVMAVIKNGKVIVRGGGGNVTPDGIIHTVGAGNGMTLTAEGRLTGDSGSGTYDRSDGCSGTWVSVRQRR
jgi:hypothetical protein